MKIGELAQKTGLSIDAIRFYEKSELFKKPPRSKGGYREYDAEAVATIEFVTRCRSLDIPIAQIKRLLDVRAGTAKSCRQANDVIDVHISNLRNRIEQLKRLERSLTELRAVCSSELAPNDCAIIRRLDTTTSERSTR